MAGLAQWEGDVKIRCESCNDHPWDSLDTCIDGWMFGECEYPTCGGCCVRNGPCPCVCHTNVGASATSSPNPQHQQEGST